MAKRCYAEKDVKSKWVAKTSSYNVTADKNLNSKRKQSGCKRLNKFALIGLEERTS